MNHGVIAIVLYTPTGEVLLQHRDNVPHISHPNTWSMFGGSMEAGETPTEGIIREVAEELELRLSTVTPMMALYRSKVIYHLFCAPLTVPLSDLTLHEGQDFGLFTPEAALQTLDLAPTTRLILQWFPAYQAYRQAWGETF